MENKLVNMYDDIKEDVLVKGNGNSHDRKI